MKVLYFFFFVLIFSNYISAQSNFSTTLIEDKVKLIEYSDSLEVLNFDANKVYNINYDGGGEIELKYKGKELKLIRQEIGLSYGKSITIIYLDKNLPIKIIEVEQNFLKKGDDVDTSRLIEVYRADSYIFNWTQQLKQTKETGKRVYSGGSCSCTDYAPLYNMSKNLLKINLSN